MDILSRIVADKKKEVAAKKALFPVEEFSCLPLFSRQTASLKKALLDEGSTGIIAEFKRQSPSKGTINATATVKDIVTAYSRQAAGISVLTDEPYFGGSLSDLRAARAAVGTPLLRKDFIIDSYQLYEAKANGADVILLIAACLQIKQVADLAAVAKNLGLEVLLEVHNEEELEYVCGDTDFVGVNNRNLKTFEVSVQTSLDLIRKMPADKPAIAESGISDVETVVLLKRAGFKGFLIGENFMKHQNPAIAFADFIKSLNEAECR